jgi:hypothetical protein
MKRPSQNTLIVCAAVATIVAIFLAAYSIPLLLGLGMAIQSGSSGRFVIFLAIGFGIPALALRIALRLITRLARHKS